MSIGDIVEANAKGWLGVSYGILLSLKQQHVVVFWFGNKGGKRNHLIEEIKKMEKK